MEQLEKIVQQEKMTKIHKSAAKSSLSSIKSPPPPPPGSSTLRPDPNTLHFDLPNLSGNPWENLNNQSS